MTEQEGMDRSKESLNWDLDLQKSVTGTRPGAKYGHLSESLRHSIPQATTCSLFCGGKKCKYENANWKEDEMAIKGMYSQWVTDNILAMARPNYEMNEKYKIIEQFKENGIKSIVNLQTPGEHGSCGPPLHESGFSYNPQEFMDNDIFFYNFGWPDYSVGSLSNILDMVKVFQFAVSEGKVAVHCHAGLGRTGVMIATYLVYANRMDPYDAVHYVRSKRSGAIQTSNQVECVAEFSKYLIPLRIVFSDIAVKSYAFTLNQFLIRQQHILHGVEGRRLKYVPKIIAVICERLLQLAKRRRPQLQMRESFNLVRASTPSAFNNKPGATLETQLSQSSIQSVPSTTNRLGLLAPQKSHSMVDIANIAPSKNQTRSTEEESDEDNEEQETEDRLDKTLITNGLADETGPESVAITMAEAEYTNELNERVTKFKKSLNEDPAMWKKLEEESDVLFLSKLMWDWLDQLKEPILNSQDLPQMLNHMDEPKVGLSKLAKGPRYVTDLLIQVISELSPLSEDTEMNIMQRTLSTLTHQHMELEATDVTVAARVTVSRRTTNMGEMTSNTTIRVLQFFYRLLQLKLDTK